VSVGTLACRQPETTARSAALRAPAVARRPRQRGRRRSVTQRRRPRRIYPYRGRVFCRDCKRRLAANPFPRTTYWRCHHDPANPRHQAAHPDHPRTVQVAETQLDEITRRFLAARVFGPGRAELLAAQLPATDAEAQARRDAQAAALAVRIRKLDTAQNAQITALEEIPDVTAAAAMRARIRTRFAELHQQRTQAETELAQLTAVTPRASDPALLDELPYLGDILPDLPPALRARLFAAVDLTILWNKTGGQAPSPPPSPKPPSPPSPPPSTPPKTRPCLYWCRWRRRQDAIEVNGVGDRSGLGSGPGPLGWVRSMVGMAGGRSGGRPGWGGSRRRARRRWRTRARSRRAPSRSRP
jgi:hypothetical protein